MLGALCMASLCGIIRANASGVPSCACWPSCATLQIGNLTARVSHPCGAKHVERISSGEAGQSIYF